MSNLLDFGTETGTRRRLDDQAWSVSADRELGYEQHLPPHEVAGLHALLPATSADAPSPQRLIFRRVGGPTGYRERSFGWGAGRDPGDRSPWHRFAAVIAEETSGARDWYAEAYRQIGALGDLEDDWNGYGAAAPNGDAVAAAREVLLDLWEAGTPPDRIVASAGEAIAFMFFAPHGYAMIECDNEGECGFLLSDRTNDSAEAWEVEPRAGGDNLAYSLRRMHDWLRG